MKSWTKENLMGYILLSPLYLSSFILFKTPFEFYISYVPVVLLLPIFILRFGIPKALASVLALLFITGLFGVGDGQNEIADLLKIWINIGVSALYFYHVFQYFKKDIKHLFQLYMNLALLISVLGIVQVVAFQLGIEQLYTFFGIFNKWGISAGGLFGIRMNSIYSEPSYFGSAISPAFFVSILSLSLRKSFFLSTIKSVIIVIAYLLTFSTVSYLGIFTVAILIIVNFGVFRYLLFALPILIGGYFYLYNNVTEFRVRVDGITALVGGQTYSAFDVHGSSFVLFNNYTITKQNLIENPLFGSGLGSHQHAYERYSLVKDFGGIYDFNSQDANSMLLRIASETGLTGLLLTFMFIGFNFCKRNEFQPENYYWIISSACLVIIILQLLRQGNYTYNGFFFFVWMYFFVREGFTSNQELILNENTNDAPEK
jgi:hypothetical protein